MKRDPRNNDKNNLKLGQFHRNNVSKKKQRKPSVKKQLRDALRLAERQGLNPEIKQAKESEAKELKKSLKKQQEAVRFETKYKKIKFIGKCFSTPYSFRKEKSNPHAGENRQVNRSDAHSGAQRRTCEVKERFSVH